MKKIIALLCLLLPLAANAQWTPEQRTLATATAILLVVDYGQTRDLIYRQQHRDCSVGCYQEQNPILGKQPNRGKVNAYFVLTPLVTYAALNYLGTDARTWALRGLVTLEAASVGKNFHLGLSLRY
jgi:hypothetical protein